MPENILDTECKEVFNASYHYNNTGYSNYTGAAWQPDEWRDINSNAGSAILIRNAVMGNYDENDKGTSGRVYTDDNNAMRFRVNLGNENQENDYYCVSMGQGFAEKAAEYCGVDLYHPQYNDSVATWGFTFKVELVDENNKKYSMNVIMIDNKIKGEDYDKDKNDKNIIESNPWALNPFTPHRNSVIEFICGDKAYGFSGTDINSGGNLSYDLLFGGTGVKISSTNSTLKVNPHLEIVSYSSIKL